ncbi:MAG TPA: hypothetical protein VM661_13665 [Candidatus Sulfotelmatobacter sp.]|jgi:hypothetical protein|nr:hypothetical protein [Candidatus Sulfotelmatobacter sp.]
MELILSLVAAPYEPPPGPRPNKLFLEKYLRRLSPESDNTYVGHFGVVVIPWGYVVGSHPFCGELYGIPSKTRMNLGLQPCYDALFSQKYFLFPSRVALDRSV